MKNSIFFGLITILSLSSAMFAQWRLDQRSMNIFDAKQDGFAAGVASAHADQQSVGKMGICAIAALECKGRK